MPSGGAARIDGSRTNAHNLGRCSGVSGRRTIARRRFYAPGPSCGWRRTSPGWRRAACLAEVPFRSAGASYQSERTLDGGDRTKPCGVCTERGGFARLERRHAVP